MKDGERVAAWKIVAAGVFVFATATAAFADEPNFATPDRQLRAQALRGFLRLHYGGTGLRVDHRQWQRQVDEVTREGICRMIRKHMSGTYDFVDIQHSVMTCDRSAALAWNLLQLRLGDPSGTSWGGGAWGRSEQGVRCMIREKFSAEIKGDPNNIRIRISELGSIPRKLEIQQYEKKGFSLRLQDYSGRFFLWLDCPPEGKTRLVFADQKGHCIAKADSFAELYSRHPDLLENRVFRRLYEFGVMVPPLRSNPRVKAAVLSELRGKMGDQERAEVRRWIAALDRTSPEDRKAVLDALRLDFVRYRPLIEEAINNKQTPLLTVYHLHKVLHANPPAEYYIDTIRELKLLDDAAYLVGLLEKPPASSRTANHSTEVNKRLTKLVGIDLGGEPKPWLDHLAKQKKAAAAKKEPDPKSAEFSYEEGGLRTHAERISGSLIEMIWTTEGGLCMNHGLWKKVAEKKKPEEWANEARRMLATRKDYRDHWVTYCTSQIVKHYGKSLNVNWMMLYAAAGSHPRHFDSRDGKWVSTTHRGDICGELIRERSGLHIRLQEYPEPKRELRVWDRTNGDVFLSVFHPAGRVVVVLNQYSKGGVRVLYLRGDDSFAATADSMAALYRQHRKALTGKVFPTLRAFGAGVTDDPPPEPQKD